MNKKNIIFLILIILGLSLLIGNVSADKSYQITCPKNSSHKAIYHEYEEALTYNGDVKINGDYYKKYFYYLNKDIICNDRSIDSETGGEIRCSYEDKNWEQKYKYVKYGAKELVKNYDDLKYWKTVKSKGNTYKYYKMIDTKIYGDGTKKTKQIGVWKEKLVTINKKLTITTSKNWKKNYYTNGYIKLTKSSRYLNGKVRAYDYATEKYVNAPVYSYKFKLNTNKNVKITKVVVKSVKYPSYKKSTKTYKSLGNGKWIKPSKYQNLDKFTIYFTVKEYRRVK